MERRCLRGAGMLLAFIYLVDAPPAWASKMEKIEQLVGLHDLKSSVAIGDYYLKQQAVLAVRERLTALGREQGLGEQWNPSNPSFQRAERAVLAGTMREVHRRFSNLEWLSEQWASLDDREFNEADIDGLLSHFHTEYGRKQVMIVDHGVAVHVQGALAFSGKLQYEFPGLEPDRERMQNVFNDEDRDMRFNFHDSPEGERFALSPLGKRYFVNAVLKVSGMISRRIDETAAELPALVRALDAEAEAAIREFRVRESSAR